MDVPQFVLNTQRRIVAGSLGDVVIDLNEGGKWKITAERVFCVRKPDSQMEATNDPN